MRGRKPKNPDLKILQGSRNLIPEHEKPKPIFNIDFPSWFPQQAREYILSIKDDLIHRGIIAEIDRAGILALGMCYHRMVEAERILLKEGVMIRGYRNSKIKHPACMVLKQSEGQYYKWCEQFGLTPASRQRLRTIRPNPKINKYHEWKKRKNKENEE
jgi:P27 family predicted phage terminase small subunit